MSRALSCMTALLSSSTFQAKVLSQPVLHKGAPIAACPDKVSTGPFPCAHLLPFPPLRSPSHTFGFSCRQAFCCFMAAHWRLCKELRAVLLASRACSSAKTAVSFWLPLLTADCSHMLQMVWPLTIMLPWPFRDAPSEKPTLESQDLQ